MGDRRSTNVGVYADGAPPTTAAAAVAVDTTTQLDRTYAAIARRGRAGATGPEIAGEVQLSVSLVSTRIKTLHLRCVVVYLLGEDGQPVTRRSGRGAAARVHVLASLAADQLDLFGGV